ncbi:hypothetical protein L9F63_027470, partial [Diploptera punctata]
NHIFSREGKKASELDVSMRGPGTSYTYNVKLESRRFCNIGKKLPRILSDKTTSVIFLNSLQQDTRQGFKLHRYLV